MRQRSALAVVTVLATLLAASVAIATPVYALGSTSGTVTVTAATQPDVLRASPDPQPAGNVKFASSDASLLTVVNGERIILEVSDGLDENCDSSGKYIGFDNLPTVTMTSSNVTFTTALQSSTAANRLRPAATGCASPFTPATTDQVVITITNTPPSGGTIGTITVSGINYDVGSQAAVGDASLNWASDVPPVDPTVTPAGTGDTPPTAGPSNAYITNLSVVSDRSGSIPVGSNRSFGTLTITESNFDSTTPAPSGNGVCINLLAPFHMTFVDAGSVAVTQGSDGTSSPVLLNSGHTVRFGVTSSTVATKSVYVLSGVKVNAADVGTQAVNVTQCDATGAPLPITPAAEGNPTVTVYTDSIGTTSAPPPPPQPTAVRFPGDNRNDTARLIAEFGFPCTGDDPSFAIVARNDDFADALAANYVAGQLHAPILLVGSHLPLPSETVAALHDLGITDVKVMGGTDAVGDDVAASIAALGSFDCAGASRTNGLGALHLNVSRIQGTTRFGTARAAGSFAALGHTVGTLDTNTADAVPAKTTAILANGRNFPDAMVAGPMAFQGSTCERDSVGTNCEGFPLVESDGSSSTLPTDTDGFLSDHGIQQVIIVGGTDAVPQAISDLLVARGITVIRLDGADRQATATEVGTFEYNVLQFGVTDTGTLTPIGSVALARGDFFTDALALGPLAGDLGEPILLTVSPLSVGVTTDNFLHTIAQAFDGPVGGETGGLGYSVDTIHLAGGTAAISTAAEDEALSELT